MLCERIGSGHINDTYKVTYESNGSQSSYVHQRINRKVFRNPDKVISNMERALFHMKNRRLRQEGPVVCPRLLELVHTNDGSPAFKDQDGHTWRTYVFVEGDSRNKASCEAEVENAARAFAEFQRDLSDLPSPPLHETIHGFHDSTGRFNDFISARDADALNRAASAGPEIAFALQRQKMVTVLPDLQKKGLLSERTVHNDAKLNNILLDPASSEPLCVIDLDTVMPGSPLFDFGDMVRSMTCPANEDERDISRVVMRMSFFEALARGYLSVARDLLTRAEIQHLAFSGRLITFETGLRFLTDYLAGDVYFKTDRPDHNLERCRTQLRLVESIEEHEEEMNETVARLQENQTASNRI